MTNRNFQLLSELKKNTKIMIYLKKADLHLDAIGYTEHGLRHATIVSERAKSLLLALGYSNDEADLAAIAGLLHDTGNMVTRINHGPIGAIFAKEILSEIGMDLENVITVMSAIGNHEEESGDPTDTVSAALILSDKSDVHRSRVRNPSMISFDIHDRVNYAATDSSLEFDKNNRRIILSLKIDTSISQVMEYFEIFLSRMILAKKAAKILSCDFQLIINDTVLL